MRYAVGVLGAAWGCFVSAPVPIGGFSSNPYKTKAGYERAAARTHLPAELVAPDGDPPAVSTFKVRAWVDADYRHKLRWREGVEELVARASRYTTAAFGASLDGGFRPWPRGGDAPLGEMLDQLGAGDRGGGADWVVGFVSAPQGVTADFHRIGVAEPMSKHFLLRDMNDA